MEWLHDLQIAIREPVLALLTPSWPYLALMAVGGFIYFLLDGARTARRERADTGGADTGTLFGGRAHQDGDGDGDGDAGGGD